MGRQAANRLELGLGTALAAATLWIASTALAQVPNSTVATGRCYCFCNSGTNMGAGSYQPVGGSCGGLNGYTCNFEDEETGLIRSGRLERCDWEYEQRAGGASPLVTDIGPSTVPLPGGLGLGNAPLTGTLQGAPGSTGQPILPLLPPLGPRR
ncbi:MAG: hypothetical protein RLO50_10265 [Azospirillaceae bacterium]